VQTIVGAKQDDLRHVNTDSEMLKPMGGPEKSPRLCQRQCRCLMSSCKTFSLREIASKVHNRRYWIAVALILCPAHMGDFVITPIDPPASSGRHGGDAVKMRREVFFRLCPRHIQRPEVIRSVE